MSVIAFLNSITEDYFLYRIKFLLVVFMHNSTQLVTKDPIGTVISQIHAFPLLIAKGKTTN